MAEASEDKAKPTQKVFDVASSPGASPNSRSIIVSHGPVMSGPSIKEDKDQPAPASEPLQQETHELTIEPLKESKPPEKPETADSKASPAKTEATETEMTAPPAKTDEASEPTKVETKPEEGEPDAEKPSADKPKEEDLQKKAEAEAAAKAEHQSQVEQLANSQKYFLTINRQERRRNRDFALIGLILALILAVAWLDVALDAGLISNTYHLPHTNFFALRHQ